MDLPDDELQQCVHAALGREVVAWTHVTTGYTQAERWRVRCGDGAAAFVKAGVDADTSGWLRTEQIVYADVDADFMARVLAWHDDAEHALLVLEDLGDAHWPPPWSEQQVAAVKATLARVHATEPPPGLPSMALDPQLLGWPRVAADPAPFLSLGMVSRAWLKRALPVLRAAEDAAVLEGSSLCHMDVRSDNLCIAGDRVVLVDWNWACRGNPEIDTAFWLPTLAQEGGPPPEAILPDAPSAAAIVAGFFASQAGLPPGGRSETVRRLQRRQLAVALPWAIRALDLDESG